MLLFQEINFKTMLFFPKENFVLCQLKKVKHHLPPPFNMGRDSSVINPSSMTCCYKPTSCGSSCATQFMWRIALSSRSKSFKIPLLCQNNFAPKYMSICELYLTSFLQRSRSPDSAGVMVAMPSTGSLGKVCHCFRGSWGGGKCIWANKKQGQNKAGHLKTVVAQQWLMSRFQRKAPCQSVILALATVQTWNSVVKKIIHELEKQTFQCSYFTSVIATESSSELFCSLWKFCRFLRCGESTCVVAYHDEW